MDEPNRLALDLVDEAVDFADELRVAVRHLDNDAAVLDFGIARSGGTEAGVLLAEIETGGLATVQAALDSVDGAALPRVELSTDHPALVLDGCQASGWTVDAGGRSTPVRGPAQLLQDGRGDADFAVVAVESDGHPTAAFAEAVAAALGLPTSGVFVTVAPAASVAGAVAASARAAGVAVSRLAGLGYDLAAIRSAAGAAPVPPTAGSESAARARSAAAIAYGGEVHLVLDADVEEPERLAYGGGEPLTATAPSDDALDGLLAPAQITLDVIGGPTHVVGAVDEALLAEQLGL